MPKKLKKNRKKKGFTLIELVIVLAVLAVIAVIAIPNFTKVRNNALIDSDYRAAESIEKITLMGIASGDIPSTVANFEVAKDGVITGDLSNYQNGKDLFRDANGPQVPGAGDKFVVKINSETGQVTVEHATPGITFGNIKIDAILAGPKQ